MPDLNSQFKDAQAKVTGLSEQPDNATMLSLYALYKQATDGDVTGSRPVLDMIGRAKYDAREKVKGMTKNDAMKKYVALAGKL